MQDAVFHGLEVILYLQIILRSRKMITDKEHKRHLKQFHKLSDRHILAVETDMPYSDVLKVVALSDKIRKAGNELVGLMRKNYNQLMRTKRYRKLLFLYGDSKDKDKRKTYAEQLNEMQKAYHVTSVSYTHLRAHETPEHLV